LIEVVGVIRAFCAVTLAGFVSSDFGHKPKINIVIDSSARNLLPNGVLHTLIF
jgi:hypothetical protein